MPDLVWRPYRKDVGPDLGLDGLKLGKNGRKCFFGLLVANTAPFLTLLWENAPIWVTFSNFWGFGNSPLFKRVKKGQQEAFLAFFGPFWGFFD